MKNKFAIILAISLLLASILGCSKINPFTDKARPNDNQASNKTVSDTVLDKTVEDEIIGIPECDEVMTMLTAEANNPDDNFVIKAGKAVFFNKIRDGIKKSIEEHKGDKAELAKNCKAFKGQLNKYKAMDEDKKK